MIPFEGEIASVRHVYYPGRTWFKLSFAFNSRVGSVHYEETGRSRGIEANPT